MHALTSIAGRENKDKHKPKGSGASTAQHKLWEPWNRPEWIIDQGGSLAVRQGCAAQRIGCSTVWADTSDRGRGFAVQKSCFSSPQLAEHTKPEVASGSLYPGLLALGLDFGDGASEVGGGGGRWRWDFCSLVVR